MQSEAVEHAICGAPHARHVQELGFADSAGSSAGSFPSASNVQTLPSEIGSAHVQGQPSERTYNEHDSLFLKSELGLVYGGTHTPNISYGNSSSSFNEPRLGLNQKAEPRGAAASCKWALLSELLVMLLKFMFTFHGHSYFWNWTSGV